MRRTIYLILFAPLAACGGGSPDPEDVDTSQPSEFCRAAAELQCASMYSCLTEGERFDLDLPATEEECQRQFESSCEDGVDGCVDSTHDYAPGVARDCLAEMAVAECNDAAEPFLDGPSCGSVCELTAGQFEVSWRFNPSFYSCYDVNATSVRLITSGNGETYADVFDCVASRGTTDPLPAGTYEVHLELLNSAQVPIWASQPATFTLDEPAVYVEVVVPVSSG